MKRMCFAAVVTLTCAGWAVQAVAQTAISADGRIESTVGGFVVEKGDTIRNVPKSVAL